MLWNFILHAIQLNYVKIQKNQQNKKPSALLYILMKKLKLFYYLPGFPQDPDENVTSSIAMSPR